MVIVIPKITTQKTTFKIYKIRNTKEIKQFIKKLMNSNKGSKEVNEKQTTTTKNIRHVKDKAKWHK